MRKWNEQKKKKKNCRKNNRKEENISADKSSSSSAGKSVLFLMTTFTFGIFLRLRRSFFISLESCTTQANPLSKQSDHIFNNKMTVNETNQPQIDLELRTFSVFFGDYEKRHQKSQRGERKIWDTEQIQLFIFVWSMCVCECLWLCMYEIRCARFSDWFNWRAAADCRQQDSSLW